MERFPDTDLRSFPSSQSSYKIRNSNWSRPAPGVTPPGSGHPSVIKGFFSGTSTFGRTTAVVVLSDVAAGYQDLNMRRTQRPNLRKPLEKASAPPHGEKQDLDLLLGLVVCKYIGLGSRCGSRSGPRYHVLEQ